MPDIQMRFNKDMLVLSSPVSAQLERMGIDSAHDLDFTILFEEELICDAYKLEAMAAVQCFVTETAGITPLRLAQSGFPNDGAAIAKASIEAMGTYNPQHVLAEIGPSGLPLDASSKASLKENEDQYACAARSFDGLQIDGFLLNGFTRTDDMGCALRGLRRVSSLPVVASVPLTDDGLADLCQRYVFGGAPDLATEPRRGEAFADFVQVMCEHGADVIGLQSKASPEDIVSILQSAKIPEGHPVLVQLDVQAGHPPYEDADSMFQAASTLRDAGVQFLRACGQATPAYSAALVAEVGRKSVVQGKVERTATSKPVEDVEEAAKRIRSKVAEALFGSDKS